MSADDSVDLSELSAALRHGKRTIAIGAIVGLLIAVLLLVVLRPSYTAKATVLLRNFSSANAALSGAESDQSALGGLTSLISLNSGMETELEILSSRVLAGEVVDSLDLQAEVLKPHAIGLDSIVSSATFPRDLVEGVYEFTRQGDGYDVSGPDGSITAVPGAPVQIGGAEITLRSAGLPDAFEIELKDRVDAVNTMLDDALEVEKLAGSVAEIEYRAHDATTAAAVPNTLIQLYLARRKTVDRGVNQRRYEFLQAHRDSLSGELATAEAALRQHQEQSGVLAPEENTAAEVEHAMLLRDRLQELRVQSVALARVIAEASASADSVRQIAAYPELLGNPAITTALSQMSALESERGELLERRTERDPDVLLLDAQIDRVGNQIVTLARSYLDGTRRQETQVSAELAQSQQILENLPAEVQVSYELERNVKRLSETLLALQTQMVQVRLAAIAEGGDVRRIDTALPPKSPTFPRPALLLALGLIGGLALGAVGAIGRSFWSPRLRHAPQLARITNAPVIPFDGRTPLLIGNPAGTTSLLVVPLGADAEVGVVAQHLASMAALREDGVMLADLRMRSHPPLLPPTTGNGDEPNASQGAVDPEPDGYRVYRADTEALTKVARTVDDLEEHSSLVIVALPPLDHPATAALLGPTRPVVFVARAGRVTRAEVDQATAVLPRLGVPLLGVVLQNGNRAV